MLGRLSIAALILLGGVAPAGAAGAQPLFIIQRSTNRNEVHYDAQIGKNGKLRPDEPVVAYWIMVEKGGRREKLNWIERKKAYGFSIAPEAGGESYRMTIVPYKARPIRVYLQQGKARAEMRIDGHPAFLKKLYIKVTEGLILPTVSYVELFGDDVKTGQPRRERITPK
jgi:hypothetical protein